MAIFVFALGFVLAVVGAGGLFASIDLLPTEIGMLYAACGSIALSAGLIIVSIGALIRRVDALTLTAGARAIEPTFAPVSAAPELGSAFEVEPEPQPEAAEPAPATAPLEEEEPLNENRSGHLPTLAEVEHAIAQPEAPPTVVGHYSAGGANYMIFSDGTIEAETEQGAFKFASMGDFKTYLAGRKS